MPAPFSPEISQPQNQLVKPSGSTDEVVDEAIGTSLSGQTQSSQAQTSQSQPSSYPPEQNENLPDQIKPKHSSFWQGRWAKILLVVGLTLAIIILGGAIIFALVGGNFSGLSGYVKNIPGWEVLFGRQTKTVQIDDSIVNTPSERASLLAGSSLADFPFERLQLPLKPVGDCHFFTFHTCPFEVEAVTASPSNSSFPSNLPKRALKYRSNKNKFGPVYFMALLISCAKISAINLELMIMCSLLVKLINRV